MIRLEQLSHEVEPGEQALENLSLEIAPGERVVLLGANGSGKSTLLKIINGLVFPTAGVYRYKSEPVTRKSLRDRDFARRFRREVVLLFQNPDAMLFNPTVFDEIAFGLRQLQVDDLEDRVRHWAGVARVATLLERPPFRLSGGEKQKVCLAALLALEPEVLLLDEPMASLDPRSTGWLVDLLQDLGITTVVTTHNLSMAPELGDRALVLSEAHRLLYDGAVGTFLEDHDRLVEANLVHSHRHRHGSEEHRHFHVHDWG
ncbi:MAG: ABC transporter ATP-binding protein [Chromatiales bacterium]|jgi:cobalt/nickel transport system ATP-binding protein